LTRLASTRPGVNPSVNFWPALATGFGASLGAFVLALEWESQRARADARRAADEANNARTTEAEKRLRALGTEDLRWRIRHRTIARDSYLDAMTRSLANKMKEDVRWLIHRTDEYAGLYPRCLEGSRGDCARKRTEALLQPFP